MKRASLLLITALIVATSCADAQFRRTIYGNGEVTKESRKTVSFNSIRVSTGINVYLTQGDQESITVEADANLQEYIITEIKGGVLSVYTDANIRKSAAKKVHVTMKNIESIKTSSAGDVEGLTPISADILELATSSAGDINIEVKAREINASTSSSGDITLRGTADKFTGETSSAGDIKASGLTVKEAYLSASSAGDIKITVLERLKARASSAGDIYYMGNPKYVDVQSSSAGSVRSF
jgi:formylmethanofuran dehydrogenase subunit C